MSRNSTMLLRLNKMISAISIIILFSRLGIALEPSNAGIAHAQVSIVSLTPTVSTPTSSSVPSINGGSSGGGDTSAIPTALINSFGVVLAAIISLVGVIAAALIASGYFKGKRKEREARYAKQTQSRFKTIQERAQDYCEALYRDPLITNLQIPNMSHPVKVMNLYVRLRVEQGNQVDNELDPDLRTNGDLYDLDALFRASSFSLENRISIALEPAEAIRKYRHCIFVGGPGAGKTTLLRYLALKSATGKLTDLPSLPIFVDLNAFASSGDSDVLDFAASIWERRYGFPKVEARSYMEEKLIEGKAILLLDSLDAIIADGTDQEAGGRYIRMEEIITVLMQRYDKSPIVLTARKKGNQRQASLAGLGIEQLELLDFRTEDITFFVDKWFANSPHPNRQTRALELKTKLEQNARIYALATTPLLLSLIAIVFEANLDLPDRRTKLYEQCVELLLDKWNTQHHSRQRHAFKPEHKRQLLKEVAWHFHTQRKVYFSESELLTLIASSLLTMGFPAEQNHRVLEEIATENGLLKKQAQDLYGFLHLTLQEYFAAQHIADQRYFDALVAYQGDPWWEEVILLCAGCIPDASPLLEKLLGKDKTVQVQEDIFHTNLILAGKCLASRPTIQQQPLQADILSRLFDLIMTTEYSLTRQQVVGILAEVGGIEVNTKLLELLPNEHIDQGIRVYIADALGIYGKRSLAAELLPLLANELIHSSVRVAIAKALTKFGERSLVPDLLQLLSDQQIDLDVRRNISLSLGILGERSIAPKLVVLLVNQQVDPDVQRSIALAVGALGEQSIVPELVVLLSDQRIDPFVRMGIADALGTLGERTIVPKLIPLLSDRQIGPDIRRSIALALGTIGERSIAPKLLRLLSNKQLDATVGIGIANALGVLGEQSLVPDLLHLLSDQQISPDVRGNIALTLGGLGERSVIPTMLQLLSNQQIDPFIVQSVAVALARLGERSVVKHLLDLLSAGLQLSPEMLQSVTLALSVLGKRYMPPNLLPLLSDGRVTPNVRQSIAHTLGALGDHSVVPTLCVLLSDKTIDYSVRQSIVYAVEQLANDEDTLTTLIKLLPQSNADAADDIHRVLWTVSRRMGVKILLTNKQIEVVKWSDMRVSW